MYNRNLCIPGFPTKEYYGQYNSLTPQWDKINVPESKWVTRAPSRLVADEENECSATLGCQ